MEEITILRISTQSILIQMPDHGLKITKEGYGKESFLPENYITWTRYPPLTFMQKVTIPLAITSTNGIPAGGTETYAHGYDFVPLVMAAIYDDTDENKYFLPIQNLTINGLNCDGDHILVSNIDYDITSTNVVVNYSIYCQAAIMGGSDVAVSGTGNISIDLYFYMWELGSSWNPS